MTDRKRTGTLTLDQVHDQAAATLGVPAARFCEAARALGWSAVRFQDTAQVIRDLDVLLQKG